MSYPKNATCYLPILLFIFLIACHEEVKIKEKELVHDPASIDVIIQKNIAEQLSYATANNGRIGDSLWVDFLPVLKYYYESNDHAPVWSSLGKWRSFAASLPAYIEHAATDGLFKEDYHFAAISEYKRVLDNDSLKRTDAVLWARADLLLTDAFMHLIQDLKQGRLQHDSLSWKHNRVKQQAFFAPALDRLKKAEPLDSILRAVQPAMKGYWALKAAIPAFLDSMDTKKYTYVKFPYKAGDAVDSLAFINKLVLRLAESGFIERDADPDSLQLAAAVKKYQQQKKITADGKISAALVRRLNTTDKERYNRIAITLDRYKSMPDPMPGKYILVNLPGYYLQVWDADTVNFTSNIICGKPGTSTPFITSAISELVIYPTWTVPSSIIRKEILPGLKKNSGYLARKGLNLYNNKGESIDPASVNWAKYSKGIPYKVQQGSGDNNALGVIKFNFSNPYDVYLHDTNQRYLFKKSLRALSHGCVRVQDWEKLAFFIARNDSLHLKTGDTLRYTADSIAHWIARKEKHRINVKNKIPLFIRYFGCESTNAAIKFYDDIYDDDKKMWDPLESTCRHASLSIL